MTTLMINIPMITLWLLLWLLLCLFSLWLLLWLFSLCLLAVLVVCGVLLRVCVRGGRAVLERNSLTPRHSGAPPSARLRRPGELRPRTTQPGGHSSHTAQQGVGSARHSIIPRPNGVFHGSLVFSTAMTEVVNYTRYLFGSPTPQGLDLVYVCCLCCNLQYINHNGEART